MDLPLDSSPTRESERNSSERSVPAIDRRGHRTYLTPDHHHLESYVSIKSQVASGAPASPGAILQRYIPHPGKGINSTVEKSRMFKGKRI